MPEQPKERGLLDVTLLESHSLSLPKHFSFSNCVVHWLWNELNVGPISSTVLLWSESYFDPSPVTGGNDWATQLTPELPPKQPIKLNLNPHSLQLTTILRRFYLTTTSIRGSVLGFLTIPIPLPVHSLSVALCVAQSVDIDTTAAAWLACAEYCNELLWRRVWNKNKELVCIGVARIFNKHRG